MQEKDVVFISWSGKETASYRMANILYQSLPMIFQSAQYFMSEDISKGSVSIGEILKNLGRAKIGIICIIKRNIDKPWLNFEAGALASAVENKGGKAIPLLIDMTTDEFAAANSPIRNYQGTVLEETDLLKMFLSINENLGSPLKDDQIKKLFDTIAKHQILECDTTSSDVKIIQEKHSSYEKLEIEVSNVYKLPIDSVYDYIFKMNFYNSSATTIFVTNIVVGKSNALMPFSKEKLNLIESVSRTGNVETGRKALVSQPIPFKVMPEDFVSGYFELFDKNNDIDINENDNISLRVNVGKEVLKKDYVISNIERWEKIEF